MKNVFRSVQVLFVLLFTGIVLSGCSTKNPAEFAAANPQSTSAATQEQATINACLTWMKDKADQELAQYDKLQSVDMAHALMHRETMGMIKDVWGKGNECKPGTNQWDAYIAYVKETETSHRQYSSDGKSIATMGILTTGAVKLTDSIMGRVGDNISTTGNDSGVAKTTTTTNTTNTATNVGDGQSTANGTTPATGTEKTGTTTEVSAAHWLECTTSPNGVPTNSEVNGCLIEYGYPSTECNGGICIDGVPYSG